MRRRRRWTCGILLVCAACHPNPIDPFDGGVDVGTDARFDASADTGDAGVDSGPVDAGADVATLEWAPYRTDRDHSPITPSVARHLRSVFSRGSGLRDNVFAKVGDSITVSSRFMHCFDGAVDLDGRDLQPTIDWFAEGDAAGTSSFTRSSLSAVVGWHAGRALDGSPSPLQQEISAIQPAYAIVMYGTNDIGFRDLDVYADNMLTIADTLLDAGIVPILSSIPARVDSAAIDANVPRWNMSVRALAQARQVPFMDYHRVMEALPNRGLGGDGVHPSASGNACDFSASGLMQGYNVRNLLALEALSRTRAAVEGEALDADETLFGDGSPEQPFVIDALPFAHVADTTESEHRNLNVYTGCAADQDESGPEYLYELRLEAPTTLWIRAFDRNAVDIDVHVLDSPDEAGCIERAHQEIEVTLDAGTYWLSLDTFTDRAGEYVLVVMPE